MALAGWMQAVYGVACKAAGELYSSHHFFSPTFCRRPADFTGAGVVIVDVATDFHGDFPTLGIGENTIDFAFHHCNNLFPALVAFNDSLLYYLNRRRACGLCTTCRKAEPH